MTRPRFPGALLALMIVGTTSLPLAAPVHSHEEINARLRALAAKHKDIASVRVITRTTGGREVLALEVDGDGRLGRDEPVLLVHGGIHGNEWVTTEVVLHLSELTLAMPGKYLGALRFHFVPVVNPDGYAEGKRRALAPDGQWYDPNREFPVPFEKNPPESRPLIAAFRNYARRGRLVGVLDYHAPAECLLWPWAFSRTLEPKGIAPLKRVVEEMARSVGYCFGQTSKVISYKHQATAQDYFAHEFGAAAVLMELGHLRGPERDEVAQELVEQERPFNIFVRWLQARVTPATSEPSSR